MQKNTQKSRGVAGQFRTEFCGSSVHSPHPSVRRARTAWIAAGAAAVSLAAMFGETAYAQSGAPIAGIARYEIEVLARDIENRAWCEGSAVAFEVSDCGLVVGQIARFIDPAIPDCLTGGNKAYDAFVYADRARPEFGLAAGQLMLLPNTLIGGNACAWDVNDAGYIVGAGGLIGAGERESSPNEGERACYWRLGRTPQGAPTVEQVVVNPPPIGGYTPYADGGFGRLLSVSRGPNPWAAGTFRIGGACQFGPVQSSRTDGAAVRLDEVIAEDDYRIGSLSGETEPLAPSDLALSISPSGTYLGGIEGRCAILLCEGSFPLSRAWFRPDDGSALIPGDRTPNLVPEGKFTSVSPLRAILDDGTAAGFVNDTWDPDATNNGCARFACAWAPGGLFDDRVAILPFPGTAKSEAWDLERLASCDSGTLVVGLAELNAPEPGVDLRPGAIWYRPDAAGANWNSGWESRAVRDLIPAGAVIPDEPKGTVFKIRELHGVNQRGDAVGVIVLESPGGPSRAYPVLLRAVPTPRVGDANGDGLVNGADLAVVLSAWGGGGGSAADFNGDGIVNGADLSIILGNWNLCPLQTCTP